LSLRFITHRSPIEQIRAVQTARGVSSGRWVGLGLSAALLVAGTVGCGDDEKCPRGTTGNPCRFDDDAGVAPTSPPLVNDVSPDTQTPDIEPGPDANDAGPDTTSESRSGVLGDDSKPWVSWLDQATFEPRSPGRLTPSGEHCSLGRLAPPGELHPYETPNAHDAHFEAGSGLRDPARTRADARLPLGWGEPGKDRVSLVIAPSAEGPDERQSSGG